MSTMQSWRTQTITTLCTSRWWLASMKSFLTREKKSLVWIDWEASSQVKHRESCWKLTSAHIGTILTTNLQKSRSSLVLIGFRPVSQMRKRKTRYRLSFYAILTNYHLKIIRSTLWLIRLVWNVVTMWPARTQKLNEWPSQEVRYCFWNEDLGFGCKITSRWCRSALST